MLFPSIFFFHFLSSIIDFLFLKKFFLLSIRALLFKSICCIDDDHRHLCHDYFLHDHLIDHVYDQLNDFYFYLCHDRVLFHALFHDFHVLFYVQDHALHQFFSVHQFFADVQLSAFYEDPLLLKSKILEEIGLTFLSFKKVCFRFLPVQLLEEASKYMALSLFF